MLAVRELTSRTINVERAVDFAEVITFDIPAECRDGEVMVSVAAPDFSQPSGAYQWAGAEVQVLGYGAGQETVLGSAQVGGGVTAWAMPFGPDVRFRKLKVLARGQINGAVGQQMSDFLTYIQGAGGGVSASFQIRVSAVALVTIAPKPGDANQAAAGGPQGLFACR